jgi:RNA polymerase sigma-70 factor (ECF subfamily)
MASTNDQVVELILGEYAFLLQLARRFTKGREFDARDLVQAAILRAYKARDQFTLGTNVRAWTSTILKRIYLNHLKRAQVVGTELSSPHDIDAYPGALGPAWVVDEAPQRDFSPEALEMFDEKIASSVMALPRVHRVAFFMTQIVGMTVEEAGQVLGVPTGTIMSRVYRARQRLRRELAEFQPT